MPTGSSKDRMCAVGVEPRPTASVWSVTASCARSVAASTPRSPPRRLSKLLPRGRTLWQTRQEQGLVSWGQLWFSGLPLLMMLTVTVSHSRHTQTHRPRHTYTHTHTHTHTHTRTHTYNHTCLHKMHPAAIIMKGDTLMTKIFSCNVASEFFSACGYPTSVTEEALRRVKQISRAHTLSLAVPAACERPFVPILYHPHNLPVCRILWSNWHILQNSTTVGTTFCNRPLVAFKKDLNLCNILVPSNLRSHVNTTPGTCPLTGARHAPTCASTPPLEVPKVKCTSRGPSCVRATIWCMPSPVSCAT